MAEKIKSSGDLQKVPLSTKITTIIIILISILSVVSIFFVTTIQAEAKSYSDTSSKWAVIAEVIDTDISGIIGADRQKQQMALFLQQEVLYLNDWITEMKDYNTSILPGTYLRSDINIVVMQASAKVVQLNDVIRDTFAYNWTARHGGSPMNNYTYLGIPNYLILNRYDEFKSSLDSDLVAVLNQSVYPEILQIDMQTWDWEIQFNTSIVLIYGQKSAFYSGILGINIENMAYFEVQNYAYGGVFILEFYYDSIDAITSALLLMTIAAVVLGFVVGVPGKKYIWMSLIIGLFVSILAIFIFVTGVQQYMDAQVMASMMFLPTG